MYFRLHAGPIYLTIFGVVTLYVDIVSLPWYWRTVVHVNPQALMCFWDLRKHMDLLSFCLKNGRLVASLLLSLRLTDNELMSTICCWLIWSDLWPLAIKILVQILSRLLSPESRFCTVPHLVEDIWMYWVSGIAIMLRSAYILHRQ